MRATVRGLAARRSYRAHAARISSFHGMSGLSTCSILARAPHGDHGSDDFFGMDPSVRSAIGLACPPARRARWCETDVLPRTAPPSRTRRCSARSTASRLPRSSSTAVMLSAHCSKVGSAPGSTGSDAPRARLVEEDQPTERCHRLDPPLKRRQLRQVLAACEPIRDEHDVALTLGGRAIGDTQVPVHRIARLREHCGSLSRGAGRRCGGSVRRARFLEMFFSQSVPPPAQNLLAAGCDRQLPDATVRLDLTAGADLHHPSGQPAAVPPVCADPPHPSPHARIPRRPSGTGATNRGLMMPRRKHTRAQQRANDIADQRRLNEPFAAERHRRTQQTPTVLNAAGSRQTRRRTDATRRARP